MNNLVNKFRFLIEEVLWKMKNNKKAICKALCLLVLVHRLAFFYSRPNGGLRLIHIVKIYTLWFIKSFVVWKMCATLRVNTIEMNWNLGPVKLDPYVL